MRLLPMRCPTGELKGFPSRKSIASAAAPRSADAAAAAHVTARWPGRAALGPAVTPPFAARTGPAVPRAE